MGMRRSVIAALAAVAILAVLATSMFAVFRYRAEVPASIEVVAAFDAGLFVSPAILTFGAIVPGDTSETLSIAVTNIGTDPLVDLVVKSDIAGGLSLGTITPGALPPGATGTVLVNVFSTTSTTLGIANFTITIDGVQ